MVKQKLTKYQLWYRENREEISKRRRERYHKDKKYRERNLKACREWRKKNRPWEKRKKVTRSYLLISEFAAQVECRPETLRNMEKQKLLPRTTDGSRRRQYHPGNVSLVRRLVDFRKEHHYSEPKYQEKLRAVVERIKTKWKKAA